MAGASSEEDTKEISDDDGDEEGQLKSRHIQEIKELRARIQALKKSVPKGDKKKKKDVTAQIAQLEQEIKERHESELDEYNKKCSTDHHPTSDGDGGHQLQQEEASMAAKVSSKSQRKKDKREKKRRDFEEKISREPVSNEPSAASIEREQLLTQLKLVGLQIKEINPDGHCMFAAVSDQLLQRDGIKVEVELLRSQCADYIKQHHMELMPFLLDLETGDTLSDDKLVKYLSDLRDTALWGGQLELRALSHIHQTQLHIYQADCPILTIGEEYKHTKPLYLVYHKHLYGLGEHYNSAVPITT
ncbi:deubiquitinase OTUD6B-like [Dysidea avara]|uniref:deubiquitinase OTUD6B-like n=1 Tax=Dysidea avara TaxID=196820 RepID=UPI00331D488B